MKRKWTIWSIICFSGIPWFPIFTAIGIYLKKWYSETQPRARPFEITGIEDLKNILFLSGLLTFIVLCRNLMWIRSDKEIDLLTWTDPWRYEPSKESSRKRKAQHPTIPQEFLSDKPDGLVLGKYDSNRFVRVKLQKGNILNAVILGSMGCGKSVLLLTMLIYQLNHKPDEDEPYFEPMTFYVTDIKPELAKKSTLIRGNPRVHVMDPQDRTSYGWDVYYNLNADSTDDDILAELDVIARALIDEGKADKNAFFYQHARTILKAVLFWQYKQGRSFMQGMDYLMSGAISDVITKTLERVEGKAEFRIVYKLLSPYKGKTGEAFEGIELAFRTSLDIFNQQSVLFFLDTNPKKASVSDLEKKISVFFSIHEQKLEEYKALLRLVTMQIMHHCSGRPENSHMLTLIVDEAARIGIDWTQFLSTSRSRQIATVLAFQSVSQAEDIWGKEKTRSLLELCRIIAILSCTDPDMANMLSQWVGEYKEEKRTENYGGKSNGEYSNTFEDKKILQQSDIMDLQDMNEVLLFIKGRYIRTNVSEARYYNIPELNDISKRLLAQNEGGNQDG